jgi:hypothetical protein
MAIKKRLTKAASLEVEFFGGWKVLAIGSVPVVFWLIRKVSNGRIGDVLALGFAYVLIVLVVFIWKCFAAGTALEDEAKWNAVLDLLNPAQKKQLQFLVNDGKMRAGQNVYDQIERSTKMIYRDVVGWWRIEDEYKEFLKSWARKYDA